MLARSVLPKVADHSRARVEPRDARFNNFTLLLIALDNSFCECLSVWEFERWLQAATKVTKLFCVCSQALVILIGLIDY
jgi:hypothetical protein